jgi:hypothetical protein
MKLQRAHWLVIVLVAIPLAYLITISLMPTVIITGIHWYRWR